MDDMELRERQDLRQANLPASTSMCGLGSWRPAWLQRLANHNAFAVAFVMIGIIQGMSYAYFNGVVTTVEKAFHVDSSTMGLVVAGNDISQIMFGLLFTYVASRGKRPFWLAVGIIIGAMSCFVYASTQLLWVEGTHHQRVESVLQQNISSSSNAAMKLCSSKSNGLLDDEDSDCNNGDGGSNTLAAVWLFMGQFISGIGGTTTFSIGLTYMDDNIKKRNTPLYFGVTASMRMLGPTLGYMMASSCLKIYINPYDVPLYESRDPRWLGAWWLGFLIIGILQTLFAFPILLFPRQLPSKKQVASTSTIALSEKVTQKVEELCSMSTLKDFVVTLRRLLQNPIMVLSTVSFCLKMLPIVGVSLFLPKYLEARFGQTASQANVITGLAGNMMIMVGIFTGGIIVWKFKPRTVFITGCICIVEIIYTLGFVININLDCNDVMLEGVDFNDGSAIIKSECSRGCDCALTFDPVCVGQQNFLSPCLAGCTAMDVATTTPNAIKNIFLNCSCGFSNDSIGVSGFCEDVQGITCPNLWLYIAVIGFIKMVGTSTHVGSLLINIRCVLKEDKGVAIMLIAVAGSVFGFIPGPIIYGAAVDSTCLLWEDTVCGEKGNCWLYDVKAFSYWFHGLAIAIGTITIFFDIAIAVKSRHLRLYDEDVDDDD